MNRFSSVMLFGLSLCALSEVAAAQAGVVGVQPKSIHGPPALEIGADGDAEFLYVQGITRTAKGEIVVGNLGSREIQVFGPNGAMLRKFGRTGQGPGEFRNMAWLGRTADSIYIYDSSQSRVSVFSVSGGFVRSVSLAAITDRVYPHARIAVDRLVVLDFPGTRMEHPHGVFVDSVRVGLIDLRKPENVQWFRTIVGSSHLAINPDNTARAVAVGLYRFGTSPRIVSVGTEFWVGHVDSPILERWGADGKVLRRMSLPVRAAPFDEAAFARARSQELDLLADPKNAPIIEERFDKKHRPRTAPIFSQLLSGPSGTLWVELFRYGRLDPGEYLVVGADGSLIARWRTPPGVTIREVGTDHVAGVRRNEDGVESVVVYRFPPRVTDPGLFCCALPIRSL